MPESAAALEGIMNEKGHFEVIMKIASYYTIYSVIELLTFGHKRLTVQCCRFHRSRTVRDLRTIVTPTKLKSPVKQTFRYL